MTTSWNTSRKSSRSSRSGIADGSHNHHHLLRELVFLHPLATEATPLMTTVTSSQHPKYPFLTLYETGGKRYVSFNPLMLTSGGITQYRDERCSCCGKSTSEPYGRTAATLEEAVEFGWILLEADYEAWLNKAGT